VHVDVTGDLVSLEAGGPVSIATILVELGAATGVTVAVHSDNLGGPLAIEDTPVAEMFNRLAAGHDVAMRFADREPGRGERLVSVWVLKRSPAASRDWKGSLPQAYRADGSGLAADNAADQAARAQVRDLVGRGKAGVPDLQRLMSSRASPGQRELAVRALAQIGGRVAADSLARALFDHDYRIRLRATNGIRRLRDPRALADLGAAARREPDPAVRQVMERALQSVNR
jgi:hypothetical protein